MFTCVTLNRDSKLNHLLEPNNSSIILSLKITILICPSWVKQGFKRYSNYYCLWIFILLSIYGILLHFFYSVWFTIRIVLLFSLLCICIEIIIPTFFLMTRKVTMMMTTTNAVHTSPSVYGKWFSVSAETLVSADGVVPHSFSNSILYR